MTTLSEDFVTEETVNAVLSSVERAGRWYPAEEIQVRAFCGAVNLDFTRAELPPSGEIDLDVRTVCGAVEITVPDGAEVVLDGTPLAGSIEQKLRKVSPGERIRDVVKGKDEFDGDPPSFHIVGHAIFGSIEVKGR